MRKDITHKDILSVQVQGYTATLYDNGDKLEIEWNNHIIEYKSDRIVGTNKEEMKLYIKLLVKYFILEKGGNSLFDEAVRLMED